MRVRSLLSIAMFVYFCSSFGVVAVADAIVDMALFSGDKNDKERWLKSGVEERIVKINKCFYRMIGALPAVTCLVEKKYSTSDCTNIAVSGKGVNLTVCNQLGYDKEHDYPPYFLKKYPISDYSLDSFSDYKPVEERGAIEILSKNDDQHSAGMEALHCLRYKKIQGGFNVSNYFIENKCDVPINLRGVCIPDGNISTNYPKAGLQSGGSEWVKTLDAKESEPDPTAEVCVGKGKKVGYIACRKPYTPYFTSLASLNDRKVHRSKLKFGCFSF